MSESAPTLLPIFRSDHQFRLLGHLFVRSGSSFSVADLVRLTGIPQPTVSREVERLAQAGILSTRLQGRTKLVEANEASPYFTELRALLLKALGPVPALQDALSGVSGIDQVFVFGSWARRYQGEAGPPPADIDVLIVGDPNPEDVDSACRAAELQTGMPINAIVLSETEWASGSSGFLREVKQGPRVMVLTEGQ